MVWFSGRYGSNGPLLPLLTAGLLPAWMTGDDLIRKSCCEKKIGMGKGKIETRGKLTISTFSTRPLDVDGSGGTLFPLLTEGGQPARSTE